MPFTKTSLEGVLIFEPKVFQDDRGYFFEAYNANGFAAEGVDIKFVQDNQSKSSYGVIRGLHYQLNPFAQSKLVRVLEGSIIDVAVDIRKGSPTYGQHFSIELTAENKKQLLVPAGFAHGFSVTSETAVVMYKCDQFYSKESEGGIRFDDPALGINWKIEAANAIVSEKDRVLPTLENCLNTFTY
jgi:dTDP-4-dehydrorhamnose 3,5-epimerase